MRAMSYIDFFALLGPVHTYPDIFKSPIFSFRVRLPSTHIRWIRHRNLQLFESALQSRNVWIRYEPKIVWTLNPDMFFFLSFPWWRNRIEPTSLYREYCIQDGKASFAGSHFILDTIVFFGQISLRRNKKQTAVINIRKYKCISGKKKLFLSRNASIFLYVYQRFFFVCLFYLIRRGTGRRSLWLWHNSSDKIKNHNSKQRKLQISRALRRMLCCQYSYRSPGY